MKNIIFFIFALLLASGLFAQHQNADAVYKKLIREYTIENDGSTSFREIKQLQLLTHHSFNRLYGETFIIYNPEFQKLRINEAYTIMADGSRVETPPNAFNEVLPRAAALSASANHLKEMVVTHTATEIGATIYLDYTLTSSAGFLPGLMGTEIIGESSPVEELEIIIKTASGYALNFKTFGFETTPQIGQTDTYNIYSWNFYRLPALPKESFRGRFQAGTPRISFSTAGNAADVVNWIAKQAAFNYQLSQPMQVFVDEIVKNQKDELKIMLAIQKEVVNNMIYDRYDPLWLGYRIKTPPEVWASNGGSKLEKSVLMAALLQHAKFSVTPVLIGSNQFFDPDAFNLHLFDDVAVMVHTKKAGTLFLSAVSTDNQTLEYGFLQNVILPVNSDPEIKPVKRPLPDNAINFEAKIAFSTELKPAGAIDVIVAGTANPFLALHDDKGVVKNQISGGLVKDNEAIKVVYTSPERSNVVITAASDKQANSQSGYYRWQLPAMNSGFDQWRIGYLDIDRASVFVLPFLLNETYTYSIELPKGYEAVNRAMSQRFESKAGYVSIAFKPKGNKIEIVRELSISKAEISPEDYKEFRTMINAWLDQNMKVLVFRGK